MSDSDDDDPFENIFVPPRDELRRPQDVLPTAADELSLWRKLCQQEAREKRRAIACAKEEEEQWRRLKIMQTEKERECIFRRRYFSFVRMYSLPELAIQCIHLHGTKFSESTRKEIIESIESSKIHRGCKNGVPIRMLRCANARIQASGPKPKGHPQTLTMFRLYEHHRDVLHALTGYNLVDFEIPAPAIEAQQLRIAIVSRIWANSPNAHTLLLDRPLTFEDDPEGVILRREARALLLTLHAMLSRHGIHEPAIATKILSSLYMDIYEISEGDALDPTRMHELYEQLGSATSCLARTPRAILSPAKRRALDTAFTTRATF